MLTTHSLQIMDHLRSRRRLWKAVMLITLLLTGPLPTWMYQSKTIQTHNLAESGFSFTVAGDYDETDKTTDNLTYLAHAGVTFHLAIGDFSYSSSISPTAWSSYVKSHLPAHFPFEILAGNKDASQINTYAADLPDHLGSIAGAYAREYSFDYPSNAPQARFILLSPGGILSGYSYSKGSSHYNWVALQIDAARAAGIQWVIVAMHKHCIAISKQSCSIGSDLQNLLISTRVDLILQAHSHTYQVSKQLALNGTTCPSIQINGYNPSCVVSATTHLTRGSGSVIVITGTGGASLSTITSADPEQGYFRKWMGANVNQTWGVSKVTVTASQVSVQFVATSGSFSDSFSING